MTSERQFCLLPECGDQIRFALHVLEPIAGTLTDFANGVQAQIGDFVLLKVRPDCLDRIELGRIRR